MTLGDDSMITPMVKALMDLLAYYLGRGEEETSKMMASGSYIAREIIARDPPVSKELVVGGWHTLKGVVMKTKLAAIFGREFVDEKIRFTCFRQPLAATFL
jgi:hypothetical protein